MPSFWIKENVVFLREAFKECAYILPANHALSFVVPVVLLLLKKKKMTWWCKEFSDQINSESA